MGRGQTEVRLLRKLLRLADKPAAPDLQIESSRALELRLPDAKNGGEFLARIMVIVPDGAVLDLEDYVAGDHREFDLQLARFAAKGERPLGMAVSKAEVLRVRVDNDSRPAIGAAIRLGGLAKNWIHIRVYTSDRMLLESYDFMSALWIDADFAGDEVFSLLKQGIIKSISRSD